VKMTFYHFVNCMALAYVPYYMTYKQLGLSEYGAFWKCATAGAFYMATQLAKMLFLATLFPAAEDDDDESADQMQEMPFIFFTVRKRSVLLPLLHC